MEAMTDNTFSTDQYPPLTHKTIGEIRGRFFVPSYQRGYRWVSHDVTRLLDDIWDSKGQDYSLQPIVVKLHQQGKSDTEDEWELIDGQQRLTTLYLILQYMERQARCGLGAPYSIRYETRKDSQEYLNSLDESFHETNIDFYHLFQAHQSIEKWFQNHGDRFAQNSAANTIHSYLFKSVRIIWYKALAAPNLSEQEASSESISLFTRLNVGRIPLTDAELIKAALLSAVRHSSPDRAQEIAAQWDGIERDLHRADVWAFVAGLSASDGDEKYPTRISLILDTLADVIDFPNGKRPRYHTFDTLRGKIENDFSAFWKEVVALHAQILGWTELPSIYNKIGFLIASGYTFRELAMTAKVKKKSEFEEFLVEQIRRKIRVKDADLEELNYGDSRLLHLLLLFNIETASQSGLRFPFSRHLGQKWSLEHIHAQNAETLNKAEQWKIWLDNHKSALDAVVSDSNKNEITGLKNDIEIAIVGINTGKIGSFSGEKFNTLSSRVLKILGRDDAADHSIRNMALLSSSDNSRLSNSVFEVKRQMILEIDRKGDYVPVCTRNVFLKYYTEAGAQQPHFWSEADKDSYLKEVRRKLKSYLIELDPILEFVK